jgi:two-component system nitrate/nitrite response regulator NarL
LISDGLSNKVIAKALNITDGTVKLHVKSLLRKLNLSSRVEAAVMATKQALCDE